MTFTTRPTLRGTFGMVSSTHWLASSSAMSVLEQGGNAFDAAVAAGFVLHVVEPHLNGPGGEMPAIFARGDDGRPVVLAGQGPAPAGATIEHFDSLGLNLVPGAGLLAAAVPGAVDAWLMLLRDHGTWPLRDVLDFAICYAGQGHPLAPRAAAAIANARPLFEQHWPTSAALWLPGGAVPRAGKRFVNRAYAATLERLVAAGEAAGGAREVQIDAARLEWRDGFVAEAMGAFAQRPHRDSSGHDHAGVLTRGDVAAFEPHYEDPVTADFHGVTVAKTAAWGQGPVLLQALQLLGAVGLEQVDPGRAEGIHVIAEAMKLAFADREAWYGDTGEVPLDDLLSSGYADKRSSLIGSIASLEVRPGSPGGREPRLAAAVRASSPADRGVAAVEPTWFTGEPTLSQLGVRRSDTCHVDVVDRWGNIISAMPSGGWLQSSPAIPDLGFCLGTRLQMCWLEPGLPSSLEPGRRPRTTLSPTLVLRAGTPVLACGSPGGDQQDQWQLLFLLRHLVQRMDLQEAIDAPTWHTTAVPSSFYPRGREPAGLMLESRLDDAADELRERGHDVTIADAWSLGRMCVVAREPETAMLSAAANPRGMQGYACGR